MAGVASHFFSGLDLLDVAADAVELEPAVVVVVVQTLEVELDRQPLAANVADVLKTFPARRAQICRVRFFISVANLSLIDFNCR